MINDDDYNDDNIIILYFIYLLNYTDFKCRGNTFCANLIRPTIIGIVYVSF